jgi:hypothetical protein
MYQYDNSDGGSCAVELNHELHKAHLELLSAHCATHQLRMRFSSDDLVRFGHRDVLRKSAQTATELCRFYHSLENELTKPARAAAARPAPEQIAQAVSWLSNYLLQQREHHAPVASPLPSHQKIHLRSYFSPQLLDEARFVELRGARVSPPEFFAKVRAHGLEPPEIAHMDSLTFLNVVVFNQQMSARSLFHALIHTVQIRVLGLERYAELWVHGFIRTRAHFTVPLEVHAFSLASRYRPLISEPFSVEEHVIRWMLEGRY